MVVVVEAVAVVVDEVCRSSSSSGSSSSSSRVCRSSICSIAVNLSLNEVIHVDVTQKVIKILVRWKVYKTVRRHSVSVQG